jgi:signal transduction histidine kinase
MQGSFRGYLLTGDSSFLEGYIQGLTTIPPVFATQRNLVQNDRQLAILDSIEILNAQWVHYANALIDSRKQFGISGQRYLALFEGQLKKQVGKKLNDQTTIKFADFDKAEYAIRNVHSNNLTQSIKRTHIFSLTFFVLTIIIGVTTTFYIVSLISKRINQMVDLAESISNGRFITLSDNNKDELTDLTSSLNMMSINLEKNISELEYRNAELDKFAYVVSHDLKAPIRGIHNVLNWIEEDMSSELSPQLNKYINIISGRTKRMENLINGLLDYARIREKTTPENINVSKLVAEIVEDIVPGNFKVRLLDLPVIFGERLKIEQVFTNLISNSVKYTLREDGEIVISCKEFEDYYQFSVKDNGMGIEPEFHERIFEMFQTLREKGEKENTGIGLAILKKIIEEQKGQISVNSDLGLGTEFIFTWPHINQTI